MGRRQALWGPRRSPTKWVRRGEEEQRNGRVFAVGGNERCVVCYDEGGGTDVLKLDDALASIDDFVAGKLK